MIKRMPMLLIAFVLAICSCGSPGANNNGDGNKGTGLVDGSGRDAMFQAYGDVLEANREIMVVSDDAREEHSLGLGKTSCIDISGDGIPELIFMSYIDGYQERLHIYAWDSENNQAVEVFNDVARSLAAGGGNYSVHMNEAGQLLVYSSQNSEKFEYGFWNVSAFVASGMRVEHEFFLGNAMFADLYGSVLLSEPDSQMVFTSYDTVISQQEAALWLEDWSAALEEVLMDTATLPVTNYDGQLVDVGLYFEEDGPWFDYALKDPPYVETCLTWELGWVLMRGDREYDDNGDLDEGEQEVMELAEQVLELLKNKEWGALGSLTHYDQGLTFSPYGWVDFNGAVVLGVGDVKALDYYNEILVWGAYDGSGEPIEMAFDAYYDVFIFDKDYTQAPLRSVNRIISTASADTNYRVFGDNAQFVEFHFPGEGEESEFAWSSLRLIFVPYGDDLYLAGIVHDAWGI
ncbi:MAG: hypothetical protein FWG10_12520 [Eubacteriaceae bacterium]|nr:hypothetical protein [Eubacteriaceae bacterium]